MLEASSTGHAQLKHKTINAEVNLLTEWQRQKGRLNDQIARLTIVLAVVAMGAFGSAPFLVHSFVASARRLDRATQSLDESRVLLNAVEAEQAKDKPKLDEGKMHETVQSEAKQFLGYTIQVINAGTPEMAFERVTTDVIGGEMTVRCKADAENNAVVQAFLAQAGTGTNVHSTLLVNAQKDGRLGPDGVGFEYSKGIGVTP